MSQPDPFFCLSVDHKAFIMLTLHRPLNTCMPPVIEGPRLAYCATEASCFEASLRSNYNHEEEYVAVNSVIYGGND